MTQLLDVTTDHGGLRWSAERACPSCRHEELITFLDLAAMPVFNNVLWPDRAGALSAPTGDISLAVCPSCGLIANTRFEADKVRYSPAYENSLHGSGTFTTWAADLADRLARTHDLEGGHVLEVGSGSGEFLAMLCEAGGCTGTGFDPSHDAADTRADASTSQITTAAFSRDEVAQADLVVCRHVLEHVAHPLGLLRDIAATTRPRRPGHRVPLYLEVPDATHMLRADAFWDVIYEHPLYFGRRALRAVLAMAGYEIVRDGTTFGQQFLWAEGFTEGGTLPAAIDGPALAALLRAAEAFGRRFRSRIDQQGEMLTAAASRGSVAVWGAGSKGVSYCNLVPMADEALVVDVNPRKMGKRLPLTGQPVLEPRALVEADVSLVVVMNEIYAAEIRTELARMGVAAEVAVA